MEGKGMDFSLETEMLTCSSFTVEKSLIIIQGGDVCVAVFILCTVHGPCYVVSISYVHEECIFSFCVF